MKEQLSPSIQEMTETDWFPFAFLENYSSYYQRVFKVENGLRTLAFRLQTIVFSNKQE